MKKKIKKIIEQKTISAKTICDFLGINYCEIVKLKRFLCNLQSLILEYTKNNFNKIKKLLRSNLNFKRNYMLAGLSVDL
jgi:hypothetical protein